MRPHVPSRRVADLFARKIGIVPRLLALSLSAMLIAIVGVLGWTLWTVRDLQIRSAGEALSTNLAVLHDALRPLGEEWRLQDGKLTLGGQPIEGRDEILDKVKRIAGGSATIFADDLRVLTNVVSADGKRGTGTRLAPGPARDAVIGRGETYRGQAVVLGVPTLAVYEPIHDRDGRRLGILYVGVPLTGVQATVGRILQGSAIGALVMLVAMGTLLFLAVRRSLRPLGRMADVVRSMAEGALDRPAPCTDRGDQLGEIGRAIEVLRAGSLKAQELELRAQAERAARDRRQEGMERLTRDFGATVSGVLTKLGHSAGEMRASSEQMTTSAARTRSDMTATAAEAEVSARNLGTVATATEELAASVGEIARQVTEAARSAGHAVDRALETDRAMQGLSETAGQIDEVVRLISSIAGQTNLLALNATIEAARAGEAGKGFAVVAGEVKALATQTAGATSRIGAQVQAIQGATEQSARAVREVVQAIEHVSGVASAIAAAVEQQGAATREIGTQVHAVAGATASATRAMHDAVATADISEATSQDVLRAASGLATTSGVLRDEVDHFLGAMRRSEDPDERQAYERVPGRGAGADLQCATYGSGRAVVIDVSLGGATLACSWPCDIGAEVLVSLPGAGEFVSARIVDSRDGVLTVAFRQDPATLARVGDALRTMTKAGNEDRNGLAA